MAVNQNVKKDSQTTYQKRIDKLTAETSPKAHALLYQSNKWLFDKIISLIVLTLFSPLFLLIALIIKIMTPSAPVLYYQVRIGWHHKAFRLYKFRSMIVGAETCLKSNPVLYAKYVANNYKLKPEDDPRITPFGCFLRKTSLDELPQFVNILKGDMSLIGPRPVIEDELKEYDEKKLLSVRPGAMGLWQACGRSEVNYPKRARLEEYYVTHASFHLDMKILWANLYKILTRKGAY